jgi:acetyl-CoA acetyltransferase
MDDVFIIGATMHKFGRFPDKDSLDMASEVAIDAVKDAGVSMADIGVLGCGSLLEPGTGQRILHEIGATGVPVYNVTNACATGATAIRTAYLTLRAGEADIGMAIGYEKMGKAGLLGLRAGQDKKVFSPSGRTGSVMSPEGVLGTNIMPGVFAEVGMDYARENEGVGFEQFAKVAEKSHAHSTLNPYSQYRKAFSLEEIMNAEVIAWPNTLPMCGPTGDGAACVILVTGERLKSLPAETRKRAVKISASVMTSDRWVDTEMAGTDVNTLTREAAAKAYELSGVDPQDLDLVELHDCFATAELVHYDNLGLCKPGEAGKFIDERGPWRDGKIPVNVSGGLVSKGHPLGCTGVANLVEVAMHLRGEAGDRQIEGAKVGLTHVIGLGSACAIHVLEKVA